MSADNSTTVMAVFDLDKTVINTNLFMVYLKFAVSRSLVSRSKLIIVYLLYVLSKLLRKNTPIRHGMYLAVSGLNKVELRDLWSDYLSHCIDSLVVPAIHQAIQEHKGNTSLLVLITNNLDVLVNPLADLLGFNQVICLETKTDSRGRITRHIPILKSIGLHKASIVVRVAKESAASLPMAYGYGDSKEDFEFLRLLGNPFIVKDVEVVERFHS